MTRLAIAATGVTISMALAGCIVVPPHARVAAPAVVIAPEVVVPPGVVYVAPAYSVPAPGYVWAHHPRHGWGYRHSRRGWHRGWH